VVDESAFRETYRDVNRCACVFEKTILTRNGNCSLADRFCIAEREGVRCLSDSAQRRCSSFLDWVREQTRFALKDLAGAPALPHGRAIRIQIGGLRGLRAVMTGIESDAMVDDIQVLLRQALGDTVDFNRIEVAPVVRAVAAFRPKQRRRGN